MKHPRRSEWLSTAPSLLWLVLFVLVPTAIVFSIALRPALPAGGIGPGWSGEALHSLLAWECLRLFLRTILYAVATTLLCIALGLPAAYAMARLAPKWRPWVLLLVIVPFWTNFVIRVFAWQQMLHAEGWLARCLRALHLLGDQERLLGSPAVVLLVSVYAYLPFAILPLYAAAEKFDFGLLDAARDLGARRMRALLTIFLPGIRRGLMAAWLMVFIPMLGAYVIPDMVGSADTMVLGNRIAQRNFSDRNVPEAAALSAALALLVVAPLLLGRKEVRS